MAKKLSFAQQYQMEQDAKYARIAEEAKRDAEARYAVAKAKENAWKAAEAARIAALTPEQREAEEAEKIARWDAQREIEIRTFNARRAPITRAYPLGSINLEGEEE